MRSLLLLLLGLLVRVACASARDVTTSRRDAAAWASCEGTLCSRIQDEAESLGRVKLLRSYVVETVRLLDHLMESMDKELVEIAEEMSEFAGPRCQRAHAILATVVEKRPKAEHDDLSAGIMEESTAQRLENGHDSPEDLSGGIDTDDQRGDDNSWSAPDSWQSSPSRESWASSSSTSRPSGSGRELYGQSTQPSLSNQQAHGQHNSGWSVVDNDPWSRESREHDDDAGSGHQYGRQYDNGHSFSNKRPASNGASGHGQIWRPSSGPSSNQGLQSRQRQSGICRGLPGSPFAVPGIDSWCSVNCGRGYCPTTHCVCD